MSAAVVLFLLSASSSAFQQGQSSMPTTAREYKSSSNLEGEERRKIARQIGVQISSTNFNYNDSTSQQSSYEIRPDRTSLRPRSITEQLPVISGRRGSLDGVAQASLLVTGNTVGSSMFCLPEAIEGVGMAWGSAIFFGK